MPGAKLVARGVARELRERRRARLSGVHHAASRHAIRGDNAGSDHTSLLIDARQFVGNSLITLAEAASGAWIELDRIKAGLDARIAQLDAHLKSLTEAQRMNHAQVRHEMDVDETALGMMAAAHSHEKKREAGKPKGKADD
jgi:hypothetical protein